MLALTNENGEDNTAQLILEKLGFSNDEIRNAVYTALRIENPASLDAEIDSLITDTRVTATVKPPVLIDLIV